MTKASKIEERKPHKVQNQHIDKMYAYVGNTNPILNGFFQPGAIFRTTEIMSSNRGVHAGFHYGDIFVKYLCGSAVVIAQRKIKSGQKKPFFRVTTPDEKQAIKHIMPLVERELKWRKDSYCEGDTRQMYRTKQHYTWTSNTEARRRAKNKRRADNE
jgi:hypothetical protein